MPKTVDMHSFAVWADSVSISMQLTSVMYWLSRTARVLWPSLPMHAVLPPQRTQGPQPFTSLLCPWHTDPAPRPNPPLPNAARTS